MDNKHIDDKRLRLALLKESAKYRAFWEENDQKILSAWEEFRRYRPLDPLICMFVLCEAFEDGYPTNCKASKACMVSYKFRVGLHNFCIQTDDFRYDKHKMFIEAKLAPQSIIPLLDPYNDEDLPSNLPIIFTDRLSPITQICSENIPFEHHQHQYEEISYDLDDICPNERLFKIDITRRKGEILSEITEILNKIEEIRKVSFHENTPDIWKKNYAKWKPEIKRQRDENWEALKIWKLRRKKKTFKEISKETGLLIPATKKAFYRAYELIEGSPYDPEYFKKEYRKINLSEVKRKIDCKNCQQRPECEKTGNYCPDMLNYINQDQVPLRERYELS